MRTDVDIFADPGLKAVAESIDNRGDFKTFMQNYALAHNGPNWRGPRRDGPRDEGYVRYSFINVVMSR
jgi:Rho GTPase-activating protein RGD1